MSDTKVNADDFVAKVERGDFRSAVASVMGQNPVGIKRTKHLLIKFGELDLAHKNSMLSWCRLPTEQLLINDQRWYVEEIARHEIAHIVVAKALGFKTGEATLVLYSPDGSHLGTSVINLDFATTSLSEVSNYLDRRVIILLSGYLAEPVDVGRHQSNAHKIVYAKTAESDVQKALELIHIKLNLEGISAPGAVNQRLSALALRAWAIVEANFKIISALAQRFAKRIEFYEQPISWKGYEIDEQPEIQQIVKF